MKIGVIGGGVVGQATARCWLEHCSEVRVHDLDPRRSTHNQGDTIGGTDLVFVCLPEANLDAFFSVVKYWKYQNFVLRSTVPIGTTCRLSQQCNLPNLVHSPEFLTARCAATDAQMPARNVIGSPAGARTDCWLVLQGLYEKRFPGVPIWCMTSDDSEAVKLIVNSFFAVKVSFFNECRSLCDKLSLDWDMVLAGVLSDGRIAHSHTRVPGPDGKRGFGGACLPKDLEMMRQCLHEANVLDLICNAAQLRNVQDRRDDHAAGRQ